MIILLSPSNPLIPICNERTFPCEDENVLDQMKKQMRIHIEE